MIKRTDLKGSAKYGKVWMIWDNRTKNWWDDHRNRPSNPFDVQKSCEFLNNQET